ncbi:hypothetical protein swp_3175 [Shewanella piezotolerans WP3]|uniref:Uncharacterized protein n=1 Tax=Shewanella piezotolerans (strain WP3 / JCM 13877) TaxID=225849 RepID=B8CQ20_SHEPW|nr:hypothetical protein [Shewanella piezotolerans]ACJ29883.1 hypothetical protein swp_3175 [Shewanella piezotolerans WP3]
MKLKQQSHQQKYQSKLAKSQRKLRFYSSLTATNCIERAFSLNKRQQKIEKYQLKILKYQAKLASHNNVTSHPIAYKRLHSANDNGAFTSLRLINKLSLNSASIHRPYKATPCKSCPALRGKACLCALKQQQRLQALKVSL